MVKRVFKFLLRTIYYLINKSKYKYISPKSHVQKLLRLEGQENISIHKNAVIQKMTWLAAVPFEGEKECNLIIGEGSIIGHFNHIYATKEIEIGKFVLIADNVYISDNQHVYANVNVPIIKQGIKQLKKVKICDGTWIGENVCIIGASIGENCVIGANSVVTKDIPSYCVAVGSPAKIIKKYNFKIQEWEQFNEK